MGKLSAEKIQIGVSSCLLGEEVRYDCGHKRSRLITEVLADYFHYVPLCPEMAIGLAVPRPPIQLVGKPDSPRAIRPDDPSIDATEALDDYGREIGRSHTFISGFILKSNSPSCGMERVKVYDKNGVPSPDGRGLFAASLMETQPLLPCEEEERLVAQAGSGDLGQIGQAYIAGVMKTLSKPAKRQAQFNVLQHLAPRPGSFDSRR